MVYRSLHNLLVTFNLNPVARAPSNQALSILQEAISREATMANEDDNGKSLGDKFKQDFHELKEKFHSSHLHDAKVNLINKK